MISSETKPGMQSFVQSLAAALARRSLLPSLLAIFSVLVVWAACLPAHAVVITTSSGTVTNFYDNFDFPGQPINPPSIDADPIGGTPGSWTITEDTNGSNVNVIASITPPDPGPFEGLNYLRIREPTSSSSRTRAAMNSLQSSGIVRADWMMYVPSNNASAIATIAFFPTTGDGIDSHSIAALHVPIGGNSNVNYRNTSSAWVPLNSVGNGGVVPYLADTWQQWTFEVDLDADLFRVGVEGAYSTWLTNRNVGNVGALRFSAGVAGPGRFFFVDAVPPAIPEPGAFLLFVSAALIWVRFRRR